MTSVMNGGVSGQQQQQNRVQMIKPDPNFSIMDLEILTPFPFDLDDFEASPGSRTPVNNSRPPSVSAVYSPLPTPLTPYQMQHQNSMDPLQASPGSGGQTPNAQMGYGGGSGSNFSFPGFGEDSQGSSTGKEKTSPGGGMSNNRQTQQQMMDTKLRNLLTNPQAGGSNAVSPPLSGMGGKKTPGAAGGPGKKNSGDARQSNQILKVSLKCLCV